MLPLAHHVGANILMHKGGQVRTFTYLCSITWTMGSLDDLLHEWQRVQPELRTT